MRALGGPDVELSPPVMEARRTGGVFKSYAKNFLGMISFVVAKIM